MIKYLMSLLYSKRKGIWGLAFIMCNLVKQFIISKESKFIVKLSLYNFSGKRYEENKGNDS